MKKIMISVGVAVMLFMSLDFAAMADFFGPGGDYSVQKVYVSDIGVPVEIVFGKGTLVRVEADNNMPLDTREKNGKLFVSGKQLCFGMAISGNNTMHNAVPLMVVNCKDSSIGSKKLPVGKITIFVPSKTVVEIQDVPRLKIVNP